MAGDEERLEAVARNSAKKKESKRTSETPQGSAELREAASGSATQGLWLRNGKVRSQISGIGRSRLRGRGIAGEVRERGRRASDKTKKRVHRFMARFARKRRASRLPCLSLGLGIDR